jgi:hypothetical protein
MTWSRPSLGVAAVVAVAGVSCLLAFHSASHADPGPAPNPAVIVVAAPVRGPTWQPTVVTAPGLPVQCADGAWTRTVVRGGCARHGGIAY